MDIVTLEGQKGIPFVLVLLLEQVHPKRSDGPGNLCGRIVKESLEKLESKVLVRRWADDTSWTLGRMSSHN